MRYEVNGRVYYVTFKHLIKNRIGKVSKKPDNELLEGLLEPEAFERTKGMTFCYIFGPVGLEGTNPETYTGESRCSYKDSFSKAKRRMISLGRALAMCNTNDRQALAKVIKY